MKFSFIFGTAAILIAALLIFARTTLAGKTVVQGEVVITERNEPVEEQLYLVGGIIGTIGILVLIVGVTGIKDSTPNGTRS